MYWITLLFLFLTLLARHTILCHHKLWQSKNLLYLISLCFLLSSLHQSLAPRSQHCLYPEGESQASKDTQQGHNETHCLKDKMRGKYLPQHEMSAQKQCCQWCEEHLGKKTLVNWFPLIHLFLGLYSELLCSLSQHDYFSRPQKYLAQFSGGFLQLTM